MIDHPMMVSSLKILLESSLINRSNMSSSIINGSGSSSIAITTTSGWTDEGKEKGETD